MIDQDRFSPLMDRLALGEVIMGFGLSSTSLRIAETLASLGGDFIAIDMQHGEAQMSDLSWLCKAVTHNGTPTIVRVASQDPMLIGRAIDLGADALVVPLVNTVEQAKAIVQAAKYPPLGDRSFGPLRNARANSDYVTTANDRHQVFVMLETREAIDNAQEILSVEGIAGGTIGPADLSLSLGHNPMQPPMADEVEQAIERAGVAAKEAGKIIGGFFGGISREVFDKRVEQGYQLFLFGQEFRLIALAGQELLKSLGRE